MNRSLLVVAFHFPPIQGSSGIHRTLSFAKYLPEFYWNASVLTARERAYPQSDDKNYALIPPELGVLRAQAFDVRRHLSILGKYPAWLARPDRWASWIPFAVRKGLEFIESDRPAAILSTYPIASAMAIGMKLKKKTGLPWVADLRDPMIFDSYPPPGPEREALLGIEQAVFKLADLVLVTTPGAAELYRNRYGSDKIRIIENGYDEEMAKDIQPASTKRQGPLQILHSGVVYRESRDPRPLLDALSEIKGRADDHQSPAFQVVFRASREDLYIQSEAARRGVGDMVTTLPALDYKAAMQEMVDADGLLLLQAENCNRQIPAKVYEYLQANRPIIALTDPAGDTGKLLRNAGIAHVAKLEDTGSIASTLDDFVKSVSSGTAVRADARRVELMSRRHRAAELADRLNELTDR